MRGDIEIAQAAKPRPIFDVAAELGLCPHDLEPWGANKAKVTYEAMARGCARGTNGKLILVTTINPTPPGEGKTTMTIGLAQALRRIGKKALPGIREPSLGPVMGIKGGAAGGGHSQVIPMEDINLHFTGDIHAVTAAHNLLATLVNNHLHFGNELGLDSRQVTWHRVMDMNDRALRTTVVGLGGKTDGVPQQDGFEITAASEVMAIVCLSDSLSDLKERLGRIIVGYRWDGKPVTASDLKAVGAMAMLLKDAMKPNLVQTLEGGPALIHGGPFANIAHGTSSLVSTKLGLSLADYFVTEAGFGSDLGAEKYFDIVCRVGGLHPDLVVMVATARALKYHGGADKKGLAKEDRAALEKGFANLAKHLENMALFGMPVVVAVNVFEGDHPAELELIKKLCKGIGVEAAIADVHAKGGAGGEELARLVVETIGKRPSNYRPLYSLDLSPKEKLEAIATKVYGARSVELSPDAKKALEKVEELGLCGLPVCVAKTQYSLSDFPGKLGRPHGFKVSVRDVRISAGAGFLVAFTGTITTMPGLPRHPASERMDIDDDGKISGLF